MTLDIAQFFAENINKEMQISHFNCKLHCGKKSKLKGEIKSVITNELGDKYLEDADMIIICKDGMISEQPDYKKSLFGVLNRSLGKVANNMSESDIKEIKSDADEEGNSTVKFVFLKITFK